MAITYYYPRPNDQLLHKKSQETNKTKTHEPHSPEETANPYGSKQLGIEQGRISEEPGKAGGSRPWAAGAQESSIRERHRHGAPAAADQCPQEAAVKSEPACAGYRGNRSSSLAPGHPRHTKQAKLRVRPEIFEAKQPEIVTKRC